VKSRLHLLQFQSVLTLRRVFRVGRFRGVDVPNLLVNLRPRRVRKGRDRPPKTPALTGSSISNRHFPAFLG
jgi:hypothetical protein